MHKQVGWTIAAFSVAGALTVALQGGTALGEDVFDFAAVEPAQAHAAADEASANESSTEAMPTVTEKPAEEAASESAPTTETAAAGDAAEAAAGHDDDAQDAATPTSEQAPADAQGAGDAAGADATAPVNNASSSDGAPATTDAAADKDTAAALPAVSNGIPVLSLDIDPEEFNNVINDYAHSYKAKGAHIRIDVPEGYKGALGTEELQGVGETALDYFRGRGNTSWSGNKKPFKLKLDKKDSLLGMNKSKHWALLSNELDESMLRNRVMIYMARELGMEYTPKMVPVDFVVNGEYQGSYLLSSLVRIEKGSVDIDELEADDSSESNITGGYLIGLHPYMKEAFENTFVTKRGMDFKLDAPDFSEVDDQGNTAPEAQKDYITNYLQKVEDIIYSDGFVDENGVALDEYLDLESAANYWWMQEFCCNPDAFKTPSNYLYKKRDGKLYWGPIWDFDLAFVFNRDDMADLNTANPMAWMDRLRAHHPGFQKLLRERWEKLDRVLADITRDGGVIDQYAKELKASWQGDYDKLYANSPRPHASFDEAMSTLKNGIEARRAAIATKIDENLTKVFVNVNFKLGNEVLSRVELKPGQSLMNSFPEVPAKEGYTFKCWEDDEGKVVETWGTAPTNMNIHAVLVAADGETRYEGDAPQDQGDSQDAADGDAAGAGDMRFDDTKDGDAKADGVADADAETKGGQKDGAAESNASEVGEAAGPDGSATAAVKTGAGSAHASAKATSSSDDEDRAATSATASKKGSSDDANGQASRAAANTGSQASDRDASEALKSANRADLPRTADPIDPQSILALLGTGVLTLLTGYVTRKKV